MARRSLEETWKLLAERKLEPPSEGGAPWVPPTMPSYDDDKLGLEFFRTEFKGDMSSMTLPRTFFGRSLIQDAAFRDSDVSESRMCWNDFVRCDFSAARMVGCDLRSSIFIECSFAGADLASADLRLGDYQRCDFTGAQLRGARIEKDSALLSQLSAEQRIGLVLVDEPGDEPGGG